MNRAEEAGKVGPSSTRREGNCKREAVQNRKHSLSADNETQKADFPHPQDGQRKIIDFPNPEDGQSKVITKKKREGCSKEVGKKKLERSAR